MVYVWNKHKAATVYGREKRGDVVGILTAQWRQKATRRGYQDGTLYRRDQIRTVKHAKDR